MFCIRIKTFENMAWLSYSLQGVLSIYPERAVMLVFEIRYMFCSSLSKILSLSKTKVVASFAN